jgi:uncharacterized protein
MHRCAYTASVSYEWDPKKAVSNLRKHELALTVDDDDPEERRFVTIGMDALARLLVVVYTWRSDNIRIISARTAGPEERRQYEEGL